MAKVSQAKAQQQGGKGNYKPAPSKMTTGQVNQRKKLKNFQVGK